MPKSAYMNDEQLAFFKDFLLKLQVETETHIQEIRSELSGEIRPMDESDQATLEESRTLNLRIIDREAKFLRKIGQSLQDIEDGLYGYCEETGEPIGIERLLLRPTATLSVDAKSLLEEKEREYNDDPEN
jgi:DnaK suppressor protein